MEKENWRVINGYEGIYSVSDLGRIKSHEKICEYNIHHTKKRNKRLKKETIIKSSKDHYGYMRFVANARGNKKILKIHREVAKAFIPNPLNKPCVNHINGQKDDNRLINLEWATYSENSIHAKNNNLMNFNIGEKSHLSKLKEKEVLEIRNVCSTEKSNKTELARKYNVTTNTIHRIIKREIWKHI